MEMDAVRYVMFAGVGGGDCKRFRGDIKGCNLSVGKMDSECDRDRTGACPNVDDACVFGEKMQNGFNKQFGLGAGNEDGGADVEEKAVKLLLAGDVLNGFVVQSTADGVCVGGLLLCGELARGVGEEGDAGNLQDMEQQKFGVAAGLVADMLACGELCGGVDEGLQEGHAGGYFDCG